MKRPDRRAVGWLLSTGLVFFAAVAALVVWLIMSGSAAGKVQVAWVPGPSQCTGDAMGHAPRDLHIHEPVLFVRRGTQCTLRVLVVNNSNHPVRIDSATATLLGKDGGSSLRAVNYFRNTNLGSDAQWDIGNTLRPGGTFLFPLSFAYRPSGCSQAFTTLPDFPLLHVSVLQRGFTRHGARPLAFVQRGGSPGCRAAVEN
jgi:hypothetical protein